MIIDTIYAPDERGKWNPTNEVSMRWREEEDGVWVRKEAHKKFTPYCYVSDEDKIIVTAKDNTKRRSTANQLLDQDGVGWLVDAVMATDKKTSDGKKLTKILFDAPWKARVFSNKVEPTYEADVPFEDRYLVDEVSEMSTYKMRKLFIDLEALQYHDGDCPTKVTKISNPRDNQMINMIGAYDSYTKTRIQWCQHENDTEKVEKKTFDGDNVTVFYFDNEKDMLVSFVNYVDDIDPDCLLAWGMGFYDLPTLYYRLESLGIGADKLSPSSLGKNRHMGEPDFKGNQYRWTSQPIVGRLVISLDRLFERIYKDSKSTNLPSKKLDIVGQTLFGKGKTEFRPDFYDPDYDEFLEEYLFYNYRDVELMVEIERDFNLIEGQQNLQVLAKCQYSSTFYGSSYARVYFMRKANFIQKSGTPQWKLKLGSLDGEDDVLQGAIVFDPEVLNTIGLHKNVVIVDFAGLYPSMMVSYNTSHETRVKPGEEQDDDIIGDGCRFRREPMGLLPSCVQELDVLRDEYKAKRDIAANDEGKSSTDYRKWDDAQKTVKRLRATFYGLMAFKGYAWGDMDIARTITYGGRTNLMRIAEEAEEMGYKLIYGHTDSCFFALGDDLTPEECAEAAITLADNLTASCQSALKSTAVVVEAELIMDRFYLPRRNRYAGRIIWQPGSGESPFDIGNLPVDKRIKMQGLEAKHTNTAEIGRTAQIEAMKLIWDDRPADEVLHYLRGVVDSVRSGDVPIEDIIARARLGKWLPPETSHPLYGGAATNSNATPNAFDESDQCYAILGGTQKAAAWHNIVLANDTYPDFDKGDSFYYTFVNGGPTWIPAGGYVGFHELSQISEYSIDIDLIIEKNIISKLDHILYGIGLSNSLLREETNVVLKLEDFQ